MEKEPENPKRDLWRYLLCAVIFFAMCLMTHPIVASFFWLNLAVALFCLYRSVRAGITLLFG